MEHLETDISDLLRDMRNDLEDEGCREIFDQEKEYYFSQIKSIAIRFSRIIVEKSVPEYIKTGKYNETAVGFNHCRERILSNADNLLKN